MIPQINFRCWGVCARRWRLILFCWPASGGKLLVFLCFSLGFLLLVVRISAGLLPPCVN